jgi:O-acetyl-ADP-ribose deacetylase (regulator of RNase III)
MAIKITTGNLLTSNCNILINTVNCVGVMGAGIALAFKKQYPTMYKQYVNDCANDIYNPGDIYEYRINSRIIINFTTKNHWRNDSELEWIENGLIKLRDYLTETTYSVAIPALGCSNGNLNWNDVKELITRYLGDLDNTIYLFPPNHRPTTTPPTPKSPNLL